jgi:hypothetical protein
VVYRVEKSKVLMEDTWEKDLDLRLFKRFYRVFQNPHVIYATTRVNSFTIFLFIWSCLWQDKKWVTF